MLLNLLVKWLIKQSPTRGKLDEDQFVAAMSKAYQNPAIMQYLNERETYLIYNSTEKLLKGQTDHARGVAGQLVEIRALRNRMKVCYSRKKTFSRKKSVVL